MIAKPHDVDLRFGQRVKAFREAFGYTLKDFAPKAGFNNKVMLHLLEQGKRHARLTDVERIAGALNIPADALLKNILPNGNGKAHR